MALLDVETDVEERGEPMRRRVPTSMDDPMVAMAAGSILLSWYAFYVNGDRRDGIFVGLWAPTLLAFASYLQQKSMVQNV